MYPFFYLHIQNNNSIERKVCQSVPKLKKFFLHFSTFHDPLIPKNPKKKEIFLALFCTYVCMSRPKSLNISRPPNARALILVPKYFYIWGIDAFKNFFRIGQGVLKLSPIFHFFEILRNFSFLGLFRKPFEIR